MVSPSSSPPASPTCSSRCRTSCPTRQRCDPRSRACGRRVARTGGSRPTRLRLRDRDRVARSASVRIAVDFERSVRSNHGGGARMSETPVALWLHEPLRLLDPGPARGRVRRVRGALDHLRPGVRHDRPHGGGAEPRELAPWGPFRDPVEELGRDAVPLLRGVEGGGGAGSAQLPAGRTGARVHRRGHRVDGPLRAVGVRRRDRRRLRDVSEGSSHGGARRRRARGLARSRRLARGTDRPGDGPRPTSRRGDAALHERNDGPPEGERPLRTARCSRPTCSSSSRMLQLPTAPTASACWLVAPMYHACRRIERRSARSRGLGSTAVIQNEDFVAVRPSCGRCPQEGITRHARSCR